MLQSGEIVEKFDVVFGTYANYYDLLYQENDYKSEVECLKQIAGFKSGFTILDLG